MAISARKNTRGTSRSKLVPGTYKETMITAVTEAEGFFPGEAVSITHKIKCGKDSLLYKEVFLLDDREERTREFLNYIEQHGFSRDDLCGLIGMQERLTLLKQKKGRGVYLNVYEREFLGFGDIE